MEIKNEKVILRDFIESDIEDRIYWETVEREWQLWDGPWEYEEGAVFDPIQYRKDCLERLKIKKDDNLVRWSFQICINDDSRKYIGWINAYNIDDNYQYTDHLGNTAIGIDIPDRSARRKGYATAAWQLYIQYLLDKGIKDIYTQTWSGNERVMGLINKLGFEECDRKPNHRKVRGQFYDSLSFKLNKAKFNKLSI